MKSHFLQRLMLAIVLSLSGLTTPSWSSATSSSDVYNVDKIYDDLNPNKVGINEGIRVQVRLQDSTVEGIPFQDILLQNQVTSGPSDDQLWYGDETREIYKADGNYTGMRLYDNRLVKADSASAYGLLRYGSNTFQNDLRALLGEKPEDAKLLKAALTYNETTSNSPLIYYLEGEKMENAYYTRFDHEGYNYRLLVMGYYDERRWRTVYTAMQPDILLHELTHSLIDAVRPDLFTDSVRAGALHESFADMNTLFNLLSFGSLRHKVLADTRGNLHEDNFIASLAERFGLGILRQKDGLRNARDDLTPDDVEFQVHDLSRVLTGTVYDINVAAFEAYLGKHGGQPADALGTVSEYIRKAMVNTLIHVNDSPSFTHIGDTLLSCINDDALGIDMRGIIVNEFAKDGITLTGSPESSDHNDESAVWNWDKVSGSSWKSAHGALQHRYSDLKRVTQFNARKDKVSSSLASG